MRHHDGRLHISGHAPHALVFRFANDDLNDDLDDERIEDDEEQGDEASAGAAPVPRGTGSLAGCAPERQPQRDTPSGSAREDARP